MTKASKDLTVAITPISYLTWERAVTDSPTCSERAGVDAALSDLAPGLERVYIFIEHLKDVLIYRHRRDCLAGYHGLSSGAFFQSEPRIFESCGMASGQRRNNHPAF